MVTEETVQAGFEQQSVIVHEVLVGVGARAQLTLIQTTGLEPEVVAAYLWQAVLGPDGSWNAITGFFHLPPQNWLFTTPILAVSIANIWRGTAFSMLVYSAALSEVPRDLEEAALVDGASRFRLLISITLPLVRWTIATDLMLITLQTLSAFGLSIR